MQSALLDPSNAGTLLIEIVRHQDWLQTEKDATNKASVQSDSDWLQKRQKDGINKVSVQSDLETAKLARVACPLILIKLTNHMDISLF